MRLDLGRLIGARLDGTGATGLEPVRQRPVIVANPRGDAAFRFLIGMLLLHGVASAASLQSALRARYPNTVVRRRDLSGEQLEVWYVYREGHWIRSESRAET